MPITWSQYRRKSQRDWIGRRVRLLVPIENRYFKFPVGTVFIITGKRGGFELEEAEPCPTCGKTRKFAITKVYPTDVELITDK